MQPLRQSFHVRWRSNKINRPNVPVRTSTTNVPGRTSTTLPGLALSRSLLFIVFEGSDGIVGVVAQRDGGLVGEGGGDLGPGGGIQQLPRQSDERRGGHLKRHFEFVFRRFLFFQLVFFAIHKAYYTPCHFSHELPLKP